MIEMGGENNRRAEVQKFGPSDADVIVTFGRDESIGAMSGLIDNMSGAHARMLSEAGGLQMDFALAEGEAVIMPELGIAVIRSDPEAAAQMLSSPLPAGVAGIERSLPVFALPSSAAPENHQDTNQGTWGLHATGVLNSHLTGAGIKVAILDTGLDFSHPDFHGRAIQQRSFIANETAQDDNGHGTHCTGTACGPVTSAGGIRYGIASEAEIFIGKVLSNSGAGSTTSVIAGIEWAIEEACHVVSLSLGSGASIGMPLSKAYARVSEIAAEREVLLVAAAGNDSDRPAYRSPLNAPARNPGFLSVAALDRYLKVASFSCAALDPNVNQLDLSAPGVAVLSSYPVKFGGFRHLSGTSMAAPHVAGIAALLAEGDSQLRGRDLRNALISMAKALAGQHISDVGAGLVQI